MLYYCYRISKSIFGFTGFGVSKLSMKKILKSVFLKIFIKLILDILRNCSCEEKYKRHFLPLPSFGSLIKRISCTVLQVSKYLGIS